MITLGVEDLPLALQFYETLGFPRREPPPSVAFFSLNGTWLGLYGRDALAEDAQVSAEGSGFAGFSLAHNVASEAAVDAVMAKAVAAGAVQTKPPQTVFWGGYSGYFKDPDGRPRDVACNPLFRGDPEDN